MKPYLKYLESSTKIFIVPFKISSEVLAFFSSSTLTFFSPIRSFMLWLVPFRILIIVFGH